VVEVLVGVMVDLGVVEQVVLFIIPEDLFRQALHILFLLALVELVPMVQVDRILL